MTTTERAPYPRERQAAWDARNLATCSCRLYKQDYEQFRSLAEKLGTTPHHILQLFVARYAVQHGIPITPELLSRLEHDARKQKPLMGIKISYENAKTKRRRKVPPKPR